MEIALGLAQVFASPLFGTLSDHYLPAILQKIGRKWDVTKEMKKLSDILFTIKAVLKDAEDKQTTCEQIEQIGRWLRDLKDVAYEVEDILDVCATEEALHNPASTTGIIHKATMIKRIKRFINKFEEIAEQRSMTKSIKRLINKFEEIAEQRSKFNLFNLTSTTTVVNYRVATGRETSSFPTELKVYGRDEEKERIVDLMVNNINAGNLSIYAIVGIGGLGKTTLAEMVYNDNMVTSRFEIKRWVCVSEYFEVKSLIGDIISFRSNDVQTLDELQCSLQEKLSGKRFLLILDDVWNEDAAKWERLKSSLSCGAKGSSIIVTTRSHKVASLMAGSSHDQVFHPKMLSEEDCFSLFKHRAFAERLKLWDLPQDKEDSIMPALWLSYKHLSPHLRQCFAYCSIFPKDYNLVKEELIQLWMAYGFLQPKQNMELEDIGNEVFNDLVWRGFFQEVRYIDHLDNTVCKMHDLVHDLAGSITRDECFSVVNDGDKELVVGRLKTTRHFTIKNRILVSPNFSLSQIQSFLRTFLQLENYMGYTCVVPPPLDLSHFIHLRVLDLHSTGVVDTMLESIARLKLLRYLDLSATRIAILSDEVFGNLINLQTLKLRDCPNLEMLPGNMRKLTNLRDLDITGSTDKLVRMPVGMGQLKCLNKFSNFVVSEDRGVGELQELDRLRGTLEITWLSKVKDVRDAENAKLSRKVNIRDLRLNWLKTYVQDVPPAESQINSMNDKLIADALQPHPNIERLGFHNYGGSDFPSWMNSTRLCSLVTLSLSNCSKFKHLPTLGLLPHLKELCLRGIPVECIGNEFYCDMMMKTRGMVLFPALEELEFHNMPSLEEWKGWSWSSRMKEGGEAQVSVFPVLKKLRIRHCPKLTALPDDFQNLTFLKLLSIEKCYCLKSLNNYLQLLTNLHDLEISNCPALELLSDDFQNLVSLRDLHLEALSKLTAVPVLLGSKLEWISFRTCVGLTNLPEWITNQRLLQRLYLTDCKNLKSLPEGLEHLTALRTLWITDCHPELHRRCQENTGEDWHKIAHIPNLLSITDGFVRFRE